MSKFDQKVTEFIKKMSLHLLQVVFGICDEQKCTIWEMEMRLQKKL